MNNTRDSRFRIRFVLITIILATLPCYCSGLALARFAGRPGGERSTPTPLWAQFATSSAATASAVAPSFTPFYVTATQATLFPSATFVLPPTGTLPPTITHTATPSSTPTSAPIPTLLPPPTATLPLIPSETLPPTVTFTPTATPAIPTDTVPPAPTP